MNEKNLIGSLRTPEQSFEIYERIPEIFADGAEIMLGAMTTKVSFYSISSVERPDTPKAETREIKLRVAMPTPKFFEICANVVANVKANEPHLISALEEIKDKILHSLSTINLVNDTQGEENR